LQDWTFAELSYFSKGHHQRQRSRDLAALQIAAAAQSPDGFKAMQQQLTRK